MYQPNTAKQLLTFDLDQYRERMAKYFAEDDEANQVFFDALQYAHDLHSGQVRRSGAPYISHPCAVAEILAREMGVKDARLLAAALLHDVVEDIEHVDLEDIETRFGKTVAELVDGCTKLSQSQKDRATLKDLTHSKIFLSASRQLGVLIIKLADRLHNLRTLHYLSKSKRQRIAQETVEVYAPLAAKLNIFPLKRELYHLALTYLYPKKSKKILNALRSLVNSPEVAELEAELKKSFVGVPFNVTVRSRIKGLGTYYDPIKKTLRLSNAENRVDLVVVVAGDDPINCYTALGVVNSRFPPIARSVRDFIANPKNNGYKSLHCRIHFHGEPYLVKIRTEKMDRWANYGLLSEWNRELKFSEAYFEEVSEFLRNLGEYGGPGRQRKALLRLSEAEEITVFTPMGEMQTFPKGSVVLDFAYKIHSDLGDHCQGALINGEWASPTCLLQNGDTVEIIMSEKLQDVDPEVEDLCKTPKARAAINRRLQKRRRQYACEIGRQILLQELERHGYSKDLLEQENARLAFEVLNIKELSELYIRIGQDLLSPHAFLYYFQPRSEDAQKRLGKECSTLNARKRNILKVTELDRAVHKFAQCCRPYPGHDPVVATLSERGVTFHRLSCSDLLQRHDLPLQRLLDVVWVNDQRWDPPLIFKLQVVADSHRHLLPIMAQFPNSIECRHLEMMMVSKEQKQLKIDVVFRNFRDARKVFEIFPVGTVMVEGYYRDGSIIQDMV